MWTRALLSRSARGASRTIRTFSTLAREHQGVVVSRAEIGGKIYTKIRDSNPSRNVVYLHEADPLDARSPGIDAKEGETVEFDLDANLRPVSVISKSGGTVFAADLLNEKIPPAKLSDDLAPVSEDVLKFVPAPDDVAISALETVGTYLDRVVNGAQPEQDLDFDGEPALRQDHQSEQKLMIIKNKYPSLFRLTQCMGYLESPFDEPLDLDLDAVTHDLQRMGVKSTQIPFVLEAILRNRELSFLEFANITPERDITVTGLKNLGEEMEKEEEPEQKAEPQYDLGSSLLFFDESENMKEDLFEDILHPKSANSTSSDSIPAPDPLAIFKASSKK